MADYVPRGIFNGFSQAVLDEMRAAAVARITGGDFTSLSGAMKSSTRQWAMAPQDILEEIAFTEALASGQPRATRVYSDLRTQPDGQRV